MLFNSYAFILAFLPATLLVFHALRVWQRHRAAIASLAIASAVFYGWWSLPCLGLLVGLALANFFAGRHIAATRSTRPRSSRALTIAAVCGNLAVLGYFKYANFFVENVDALLGLDWALARVVLPLGISFFTFQKIAFVVDCHRGRVERFDLLEFLLFVGFFPQLIAGPIVHPADVLPQFRRPVASMAPLFALGLTIFVIGLGKKVLLADPAATYAAPVFDAAAAGVGVGMAGAWQAALAYTVQLYFDFSGYSDMAIGTALLFGIRLPLNFASPYKSRNIAEFWRRWHMTLSRLLRDYVYIPLGGNRHGRGRQYANLMLTMLIGGLWHGAAWTFVAWGALHGAYLGLHQLWQAARARVGTAGTSKGAAPERQRSAGVDAATGRDAATALEASGEAPTLRRRIGALAATAMTFLAVVVGWVLFRAADLPSAAALLGAMAGRNGVAGSLDAAALQPTAGSIGFLLALLAIAWWAPNTQQITGYAGVPDDGETADAGPSHAASPTPAAARAAATLWRPSPAFAVMTGAVFAAALMSLSQVSEFLYFQF